MTESKICACPSGDGSLRWPCPKHPAVDQADVAAKLTFINGRPAMCGCQVEYSDGGGEYSDVIYVTLCAKHSGSAILDLVATNRIALTPEYEGQWHADLYLDREIPLAKVEGATPAEAVLALMSAERVDPEQESVEQASGDERAAFERFVRKHCGMPAHIAVNWDAKFTNDAWEGWKARAALAQPSPMRCLACGGYHGNSGLPCPNMRVTAQAQPSPAQAEQHWPKLEKPAQVGAIRFSAGVSSRLVVEAAQRLYEFESTPEKEAERIERLQAFREQCFEPLGAEFSKVLSENLVELSSEAKPEQAEAERPELWAVHAQGPDELYAAFTREDAEKHAAELNALPMPEGIAVGAVVVPSPWPAVQHWQYLAEQEQDHKNEIAGRLRQIERICEGLPQDAIDGGWTVQGIRGYAKRLEDQLKAALARVAEMERQEPVDVPGPDEIHQMAFEEGQPAEDGDGYLFSAEEFDLFVQRLLDSCAPPVAQAQQLNDLDKQCRDDVARALGLRPNQERGFAWSYLLASIKSCVKASEDSAQAQHSVPEASEQEKEQGWTLDYRFVERVTELAASRTEYTTSMEATEQVLLAARELLAAAPGKEVGHE
ncbi:TPA: hypothetical protein ACGSPD_001804 [Pseudomonas aeruginosa]